MTLLDVGSNTCWASAELARRGLEVVALDIATVEMQGLFTADWWLEASAIHFERVLSVMFDPALRDDSFDVVFCSQVLHHNDPDGLRATFRELRRVLKPGGMLLVANEPMRFPTNRKRDHGTEVAHYEGHEHVYYFHDYMRAARAAGFDVEPLPPPTVFFSEHPLWLYIRLVAARLHQGLPPAARPDHADRLRASIPVPDAARPRRALQGRLPQAGRARVAESSRCLRPCIPRSRPFGGGRTGHPAAFRSQRIGGAMQRAIPEAGRRRRERPGRAELEPAALELVRTHGGRLMSVARRYSATREDAEDAYQRAVEILLTRAPTTDVGDLLPWMKTVVKHEAFALRRQRARHGTPSEAEQIEPFAGLAPGPAELAERRDRLRLGAEALRALKPQEVRALVLRAEGLSYGEICARTGWTYTKVNRCLSEGRRSFLARVAGIEAGDECERLAPLLSALADGEASDEDLVLLRPHLGGCLACRARLREYRRAPARAAAAAVAPAGAIAALCGSLREGARSSGVRIHDVAAWLNERGQELVLRWDGAVQAAAAHKVAAVAASAAMLAGGGAATVGALGGPLERPAAAHRAPARPGPHPPATRHAASSHERLPRGGTHPRSSPRAPARQGGHRRAGRPRALPARPRARLPGVSSLPARQRGASSALDGPRPTAGLPAARNPGGGEFAP